eukprot:SAG11_NODE_10929_length_795_cov_4.899425_1_plen_39_part_10
MLHQLLLLRLQMLLGCTPYETFGAAATSPKLQATADDHC